MALKDLLNDLSIKMHQRSPEILTGLGIAGMILAVPLAVTGTIKACDLIQDEKRKKKKSQGYQGTYKDIDLTKKEIVKVTWKCYIPTAISMTSGMICVLGGLSISSRRNVALATAYSISEDALRTYQKKVVETIGEKKEEKIRDEIAKEELKKHPISTSEVYVTKKGTTLCYDTISKRYFKSDIETLRKAKDRLNNLMYQDMFVSLNEYYYEIGLPIEDEYDDLGWCVDNGPIEFRYSLQFADDDMTPCVVATSIPAPRYGYGYDQHLR